MGVCFYSSSFLYILGPLFLKTRYSCAEINDKFFVIEDPGKQQWPLSFNQQFKNDLQISKFLHLFEECHIYIVNYRGEDLAPFHTPVQLARYKFLSLPVSFSNGHNTTWDIMIPIEPTQRFLKSAINISFNADYVPNVLDDLMPGNNLMFPKHTRNTLENWRCFVQVDLFPPASNESDEYKKFMEFPVRFNYFRDPHNWLHTNKMESESK